MVDKVYINLSPDGEEVAVTSPAQDPDIPNPKLIHNAIWVKAYNNLKEDDDTTEYVIKYEELMRNIFSEDPIHSDLIDKTDQSALGDRRLELLIERGSQKVSKNKATITKFSSLADVIDIIKTVVGVPLSNIIYTALPWAVVASCVEVSLSSVAMSQ
jgi:hypothetical protein